MQKLLLFYSIALTVLVMVVSCKKEDDKLMVTPATPTASATVSSTTADMVGDWICDGDSIYTSAGRTFDSTYVNWHLELITIPYGDSLTVGPGYMQSGWYNPPAPSWSTPYYWKVVDTGDPHYQLNCYLMNSYPYQYIMSLTPTTLVLATNEGYTAVRRRLFHK